jgi:hypothetical protein
VSFACLAAEGMMRWSDLAYEAEWHARRRYDISCYELAIDAERMLVDATLMALLWLLDEFEEDDDE